MPTRHDASIFGALADTLASDCAKPRSARASFLRWATGRYGSSSPAVALARRARTQTVRLHKLAGYTNIGLVGALRRTCAT